MKKRGIGLLFLALLLLLGCRQGRALAVQRQVADKVVRLHVLANSDSPADQEMKLQVKDAVYAAAESLLRQSESRQQAVEMLQAALPELQSLAQQTLYEQGSSYSVELRLEETDFPYKEYEGFSLPAGKYLALRVLIGEARGQNWWCVVFPPLCGVGVEEVAQEALRTGFTQGELRLLMEGEGGVLLRFRFLDWWQRIWKR